MRYLTILIVILTLTFGFKTVSYAKNVKNNVKKSVQKVEKININTASVEELTKLKGIGVKKAKAIVEFRKKNGNFKKPEDIMLVKGIGKKTYERLKPYITVK